jgi:hypothetical protein
MPHLGRGLGDDPEAAAVRVRGRVGIDAFALALAGNQVVAAHRDSEDLLVALSAEGAGYATLVGRNEAATQAAIVNVPNARGLPLSLSATKTAASPSFIELTAPRFSCSPANQAGDWTSVRHPAADKRQTPRRVSPRAPPRTTREADDEAASASVTDSVDGTTQRCSYNICSAISAALNATGRRL